MATREQIFYVPARPIVEHGQVNWRAVDGGQPITGLPQIFWETGHPWREVNLWLFDRLTTDEAGLNTVRTNARHLSSYASWLESNHVSWTEFPTLVRERCVYRYKAHLKSRLRQGAIASSTAAQQMIAVVAFYRWAYKHCIINSESPLWKERQIGANIEDGKGFLRTITVRTTDLAIPNRKAPGEFLEDGLVPISWNAVGEVVRFALTRSSQELGLFLLLGFTTGMRLGTICDLKLQTILAAAPDPGVAGMSYLSVGPQAKPRVHTKYGVQGQIPITDKLLSELKRYAFGARRLKRQLRASPEDRELLFLTPRGKHYARAEGEGSAAVDVAMHRLRQLAQEEDLAALTNFHFHQTRATFATQLTRMAMATNPKNALAFVKQTLLHRDERAPLRYIKFVETEPTKEAVCKEFSELFMGLMTAMEAQYA